MPAERTLPAWPFVATAILGAWLATAPATMHPHPPALAAGDVAAGVAVIALSAFGVRRPWAAWTIAGVGGWLMLAPLVLWAPTAAAYATDTLVGGLLVAFALLVPGAPGTREPPGPDVPPGWSYNPSAWPQRAGIIALALAQFLAARYMAAHQLGHVPHAWDPAFGDGTRRVLNSDVSKAFPVSDAGLGAVTYLVEALTGFLGGPRRWRSMPWAVLLFGVLVVPVGVVSIVLVVLQPLAVGAWCGLCLITAFVTVFMVSPAVDELVATGQFLLRVRRDGKPFWPALWRGDAGSDAPAPPAPSDPRSRVRQLADGMELTGIPWNLVLVALAGAWLMAAPAVFGHTGPAAGSDQIAGALVVTFAVVAFGESARAVRWLNLPLGLWLTAAPWFLSGNTTAAACSAAAAGAAVLVLGLRRGPVDSRFGGWDRWVF